jgi:hypothetical protein
VRGQRQEDRKGSGVQRAPRPNRERATQRACYTAARQYFVGDGNFTTAQADRRRYRLPRYSHSSGGAAREPSQKMKGLGHGLSETNATAFGQRAEEPE